MINKSSILFTSMIILLAQGVTTSWGAVPPPNPTESDVNANTAGGTSVLLNNEGIDNSGFGYTALMANTIGQHNTAIGSYTLSSNTSGFYNTASGNYALSSNTSGFYNTASGALALRNNTTGEFNTASGYGALFSNISGNSNTAYGVGSLQTNTIGESNTASGSGALNSNDTGNYNTALGLGALGSNSAGSTNTAVGLDALYFSTGDNNLALGYQAGRNLIAGNNNIYLGNNGLVTESSTIRIGGINQTRTFIAGIRGRKVSDTSAVEVVIDNKGQLGTIKSSQRFKRDIRNMDDASHHLLQLRPVTYHYKESNEDGSNPLEYGLIAEEVAKIYPDLVAYGADGKIETVQYHKLTPMLVNEVKRLNSLLQSEKDKNVAQTREISDLKTQSQKIALLESKLQAQNQETANLKQQMIMFQTQAKSLEALTTRLSRIEATKVVGMAQ